MLLHAMLSLLQPSVPQSYVGSAGTVVLCTAAAQTFCSQRDVLDYWPAEKASIFVGLTSLSKGSLWTSPHGDRAGGVEPSSQSLPQWALAGRVGNTWNSGCQWRGLGEGWERTLSLETGSSGST